LANKVEFKISIDGLEQFQGNINKAGQSLEEFSKVAKNVGRELSQIGGIVTAVGGAISGPLLVAFNNAAKSSAKVANEVGKLKDITEAFQKDIATAILPVIQKFTAVLNELYQRFKNLDEAVKSQLLQQALLTGIFLTLSGIITIIVGKFFQLIASVTELAGKFIVFASANPMLIAIGVSLAVIVGLMFKFKVVADVVLSAFEALFLFLKNGFLTIKIALEGVVFGMVQSVKTVVDLMAKIPGPTQTSMRILANEIQNISNVIRGGINKDLQGIIQNAETLGSIFTEGQGSWSIAFDELKTKASELFNIFTSAVSTDEEGGGFVTGFLKGIETIGIKLNNLKQVGQDLATTLHTGLSAAFSDIILGTKTAKEAFMTLGQTMLKALVDFVAQWLAFQIISKAGMLAAQAFGITLAATLAAAYAPAAALASLASFGGNAAPAQAGIVSTVALANLMAIPKFAEGSGKLKDDTLGLFNKNEMIIPNTFADSIRNGELTLSGEGGKQGGVYVDLKGSTFNGITQEFVEDVFKKAGESIANRTLAFSV